MRIDSYSFGFMRVAGEDYRKDLIVFPDTVASPWWRQSGHSLSPDDLAEILPFEPEVLVVGTGAYGVMKVPAGTMDVLEKAAITVIVLPTGEAWQRYNDFAAQGRKAVGAFHLTC